MAPIAIVNDPNDPRLAPYRDLRDRERATRTGRFVAEGRFVFERLVAAGRHRVESVLLSPVALEAVGTLVARLPPDTPVYVLPPAEIRKTAGFAIHQGCVALASRGPEPGPEAALAGEPPTVLVLDDLADPDNVGSIFRSARTLGGDAILIGPGTADPLYRKTIRTSMGTVFDLPYGRSQDLAADAGRLRRRGYQLVALTPSAAAVPVATWAAQLGTRQRIALWVGNEGRGVAPQLQQMADVRVRVPMRPDADSLNVHVTAAIVLALLGRA